MSKWTHPKVDSCTSQGIIQLGNIGRVQGTRCWSWGGSWLRRRGGQRGHLRLLVGLRSILVVRV